MLNHEQRPFCQQKPAFEFFDHSLDTRDPSRTWPVLANDPIIVDRLLVFPEGVAVLDKDIIGEDTSYGEEITLGSRPKRDTLDLDCYTRVWRDVDKRVLHWHLTIKAQVDDTSKTLHHILAKATAGEIQEIKQQLFSQGTNYLPYCHITSDSQLKFFYPGLDILFVGEEGLRINPEIAGGQPRDTNGQWVGDTIKYRLNTTRTPFFFEMNAGFIKVQKGHLFRILSEQVIPIVYGIKFNTLNVQSLVSQVAEVLDSRQPPTQQLFRAIANPYLRFESDSRPFNPPIKNFGIR